MKISFLSFSLCSISFNQFFWIEVWMMIKAEWDMFGWRQSESLSVLLSLSFWRSSFFFSFFSHYSWVFPMSFSHSCGQIKISTRFILLHEHTNTHTHKQNAFTYTLKVPNERSISDVSWEERELKKLWNRRRIKILHCSFVIDGFIIDAIASCEVSFQLLFMMMHATSTIFMDAYGNQIHCC